MKLAKFVFLSLGVLFVVSCNDRLSDIGPSVQPHDDRVAGNEYELLLQSNTVKRESIYSSNTLGVLGSIYDESFGDFNGEFLAQVRTGDNPGFDKIVDNKIDSTVVRINFKQYVGDKDSPIKIGVYSLDENVTRKEFSVSDLSKYRKEENLIGVKNVILSKDAFSGNYGDVNLNSFDIKINNEIGEKIYNTYREHPEYFKDQDTFNEKVLHGFIISPQTGRGFMVQTVGIALNLYYTVVEKDKDGKDTKVAKKITFINTENTSQVNGLVNKYNDKLLEIRDDYTYVTSPAGVITRITLSKDEINKILKNTGNVNVGHNWMIVSAQSKLKVEVPEKVLLNPAANVLVVRSDVASSFFEKDMSVSGFNAMGFISTTYDITKLTYDFSNISGVLNNFIKENAKYDATSNSLVVNKDLDLDIIPVNLQIYNDSNSGRQYSRLQEYMFPSIVRLSKKQEDLKLRVITSKFN